MPKRLLIAGGAADPHLARLREAATARHLPVAQVDLGPDAPPLSWRLGAGGAAEPLIYDGAPVAATAAFVRQDVYRYLQTQNPTDQSDARSYKLILDAWLMATPTVRRFNEGFALRDAVNKPFALCLAQAAGLPIPDTCVTDDAAQARALADSGWVYKPVVGGDACRTLTPEAVARYGDRLPRPYIFQARMVAPELRVFRIGDQLMGFEMRSDALDYRQDPQTRVVPAAVPPAVAPGLMAVSEALGLTYAAADFKTDPATGALAFLEINSNPMFAAFDEAVQGGLCAAMVDWLALS